jgi:hypothetical protein
MVRLNCPQVQVVLVALLVSRVLLVFPLAPAVVLALSEELES